MTQSIHSESHFKMLNMRKNLNMRSITPVLRDSTHRPLAKEVIRNSTEATINNYLSAQAFTVYSESVNLQPGKPARSPAGLLAARTRPRPQTVLLN